MQPRCSLLGLWRRSEREKYDLHFARAGLGFLHFGGLKAGGHHGALPQTPTQRPVDDLHSKRELNKGFASAASRGFEFAITIVIFGGLGWLLDRWFGTAPICLIVLTILAFVGNFARMWYSYDAAMTKLEADLPGRTTEASS
jgi:F0F1-type ATP synthase assembly protein I